MKTTIELSQDLFARAKQLAQAERRTCGPSLPKIKPVVREAWLFF